jgi:hypothetical protein
LIFKQEKLFGRAREGNLGSRRIFLTVLAGRYLPTPGLMGLKNNRMALVNAVMNFEAS